MGTEAAALPAGRWSAFEQLRYGREILQRESHALAQLAKRLGSEFCSAVEYLLNCRGSAIITGIGKAGLVGQKIAATLASTGTPSHFLHPAEAVHGDLGRVRRHDVVLVLSQSGETEEVVRLLPSLAELGVPVLAITGRAQSALGRAATVTLQLGPLEEADALGLAPSTSTTAMLALGDALALVVSRLRNFGRDDFARLHPGGALGRRLSKVEDLMRPLSQCRVADERLSVREVLIGARLPGRRTGATMLIDPQGKLSGIFTDSDLARLFEQHRDGQLDAPVRGVMTCNPLRVPRGAMVADAVSLMAAKKISELPVVDAESRPLGLIDITDVVGMLPPEPAEAPSAAQAAKTYRIYAEPAGRDDA